MSPQRNMGTMRVWMRIRTNLKPVLQSAVTGFVAAALLAAAFGTQDHTLAIAAGSGVGVIHYAVEACLRWIYRS